MEESKILGIPLAIYIFILLILVPLLYGDYLLWRGNEQIKYGVYAIAAEGRSACSSVSSTPTATPSLTPTKGLMLRQGSPSAVHN